MNHAVVTLTLNPAIDLTVEGREGSVQVHLTFAETDNLPRRIFVHRRSWSGYPTPVEVPVAGTVVTTVEA